MIKRKQTKTKKLKPLKKYIKVKDTGGLYVDPYDFFNSIEGQKTMRKFETYLKRMKMKR